jgi:hypothetical protein
VESEDGYDETSSTRMRIRGWVGRYIDIRQDEGGETKPSSYPSPFFPL